MAQKNRSKELWLIPKRGSLHQTICLIDGITERNYDGTSWNPQKQNNLGVNLKKWGATKSGKNVSAQSIRTLIAAVPQYLGFLYINTRTTPNSICITDSGKKLLSNHKEELIKVKNLSDGDGDLIKQSEVVLAQMEKLQLTNPIYLKDCENILVFPFRMTLKILLKLGYLDTEEIAYFLLKIRDESEFELTIKEIQNFRKYTIEERAEIIDVFKQTHIGNITLVKAASASYYQGLCQITGIIDRFAVKPDNRDKKIGGIRIKDEYVKYAEEAVNCKYADANTYDFADNLELWIEYIGNPNRLSPPIDVEIENNADKELFIQVKKNGEIINVDLLEINCSNYYPMFMDEVYELVLIDIENGMEISTEKITPSKDINNYKISGKFRGRSREKSIEQISAAILEHSNCSTFHGEILNYLTVLSKIIDVDKTEDKSLRGAYYEYLFYQLLSKLKDSGVVDDVIWNGKVGKYGLPTQAPGGRTGNADMIFIINDNHYVLELTTIKSKSGQEKAEVASVPDHIRLYKGDDDKNVVGIFCAPMIHERNTAVMKSVIQEYKILLNCLTDKKLVELLISGDKERIQNELNKG